MNTNVNELNLGEEFDERGSKNSSDISEAFLSESV